MIETTDYLLSPVVASSQNVLISSLLEYSNVISQCVPRGYEAMGLNEVGRTFYMNTVNTALEFANMGDFVGAGLVMDWDLGSPDLNHEEILGFIEDADLKLNVSRYLRFELGSEILRSAKKHQLDNRMAPLNAISKASQVVREHLEAIAARSIIDFGIEMSDSEAIALMKIAKFPKLKEGDLVILTFLDDLGISLRPKDPRTKKFI